MTRAILRSAIGFSIGYLVAYTRHQISDLYIELALALSFIFLIGFYNLFFGYDRH